jgi:hypothetical protein
MQNNKLEQLWEEAIANFPYKDLEPTSYVNGDLEAEEGEEMEYSEEFTFTVGKLIDQDLVAGGWIDLHRYDGEVSISGLFAVSRDGDWEEGHILPECTGVLADYDLKSKTWEMSIDSY